MAAALNFILEEESSIDNFERVERLLHRPRLFQERRDYYEEYDDLAFSTRFRLSKSSVIELLQEIEKNLEFPNDRNNSLSPVNQLLLTLRYYATGSYQLTMGDFAGVSRPTANRVIHRVSAVIASLAHKHMTQLGFYTFAKFPGVVGALDCTHIKVRSPGGTYAERFRNRKGYMSLNVQVICDANLKILDLVARWPGSAHDELIFSSSRINSMFELEQYNNSVLVADSGYINRDYIMMPLASVSTVEESLYNESQIRTRNPIERLFGIWKRRFPLLAVTFENW